MSETRTVNLDTEVRQGYEGYSDFHELLNDAIDLASDQATRTRLSRDGKVIAAIVTTEDLERLEQLDRLCHCGPHDWKDECPLHGSEPLIRH